MVYNHKDCGNGKPTVFFVRYKNENSKYISFYYIFCAEVYIYLVFDL